jgi:hypothetical protein
VILPERADPPRHHRLILIKGDLDWLTDNKRMHWRSRARHVAAWRRYAAMVGGIFLTPMPHGAHVIAELRFADARRRDPNNWNPTAKACIDGLVDAGIFRDDHAGLILGPDMRLGPRVVPQDVGLILHFWPKESPP